MELKSTRVEQRTTTDEQTGPKIPTVELMTTRVELMALRTTSVELMVRASTEADQAGLE